MRRLAVALLLSLLPAGAIAQPAPPLTLEQRMLLRCSAGFALLANRQQAGEAAALAMPAMGTRGQEFFVRASARVMEEAGLAPAGVTAALAAEAQDIVTKDTLAQVIDVCLPLLPPQ